MSNKVRIAIIGAGNCASALVQGVHYYQDAADDELVPGLMHVNLGGYHVRDVEFAAAFDIDANKVARTSRRPSLPRPTIRSASRRCRPWACRSIAA